jgi:hypothetical protein
LLAVVAVPEIPGCVDGHPSMKLPMSSDRTGTGDEVLICGF